MANESAAEAIAARVTDHHVAFLQARGYSGVTTIEQAVSFVLHLEPENVEGFFADAGNWTPPPSSSPEDTQDVTAAAVAVAGAASSEQVSTPSDAVNGDDAGASATPSPAPAVAAAPPDPEPLPVLQAQAAALETMLNAGNRVRIQNLNMGICGEFGTLVERCADLTRWRVQLHAPCYGGAVIELPQEELIPAP